MKRYRAPGDPGEFGDWIVGVIDLRSDDEGGLREALNEIVDATQDMKSFMRLTAKSSKEAMHYTLRFSREGDLSTAEHEREFWKRAAQFTSLHQAIAQYVEQVNSNDDADWQDEFHPRGSFAIAELVLANARWCSLLGRLLFKWDMAHETFQEGLIDELFVRHGMVADTLNLLACRVLADGQSIPEQIAAALYDHNFRARLDIADFAQRCSQWVQLSISSEIGLDQFATIYAKGDATVFESVWSAFRQAGIKEQSDGFDVVESLALCDRRSVRLQGHWDTGFMVSSVEILNVETLVPLPS